MEWPATVAAVRAVGRCSFAMKRGFPATNTLAAKPGAMQPWSDAHYIERVAAISLATALTNGSIRPARGSRAGIAHKAIKAS